MTNLSLGRVPNRLSFPPDWIETSESGEIERCSNIRVVKVVTDNSVRFWVKSSDNAVMIVKCIRRIRRHHAR